MKPTTPIIFALLMALLAACGSDEPSSEWSIEEGTTTEQIDDGDTVDDSTDPVVRIPQPGPSVPDFSDWFDSPTYEPVEPDDCLASGPADAATSCNISVARPAGTPDDIWTIEFDRWGKVVERFDVDYEYDCEGRLIREREGERTVSYVWDGSLLVSSREVEAGETVETTYEYDDEGRITRKSIIDADATEEWIYPNDGGETVAFIRGESETRGEYSAEVWVDSDGMRWEGERAGCHYGELLDADGRMLESRIEDCAAFGGSSTTTFGRDDRRRLVSISVTSYDEERLNFSYEGDFPLPVEGLRRWPGDEGSRTLNIADVALQFEYDATSMTMRSARLDDGSALAEITFDSPACFPTEAELIYDWAAEASLY